MADNRCVILFVKLPEPGKVKSRLARDLNSDLVLRLYDCMVLDAIDMLKQAGTPFRICFDPPEARERVRQWLGQAFAYMPQSGNDLGERMEQAFSRVFSEGTDEAVLIGSDIPELTAAVIAEAFQSLTVNDAVIGPANDGGYYLMGFKKSTFVPGIFQAMAWSSNAVFGETSRRLLEASLSVHRLPELTDIDTRNDMEAFFLRAKDPESGTTRTRSFLEKHRHLLFTGNKPSRAGK